MLGLEKAAAANGKMGKSKTYCNDYEDYEEGKNAKTLVEDILNDPELPQLEELAEGLGRRCPELSVRRLGGELLLSPVREWMRA